MITPQIIIIRYLDNIGAQTIPKTNWNTNDLYPKLEVANDIVYLKYDETAIFLEIYKTQSDWSLI